VEELVKDVDAARSNVVEVSEHPEEQLLSAIQRSAEPVSNITLKGIGGVPMAIDPKKLESAFWFVIKFVPELRLWGLATPYLVIRTSR